MPRTAAPNEVHSDFHHATINDPKKHRIHVNDDGTYVCQCSDYHLDFRCDLTRIMDIYAKLRRAALRRNETRANDIHDTEGRCTDG